MAQCDCDWCVWANEMQILELETSERGIMTMISPTTFWGAIGAAATAIFGTLVITYPPGQYDTLKVVSLAVGAAAKALSGFFADDITVQKGKKPEDDQKCDPPPNLPSTTTNSAATNGPLNNTSNPAQDNS